MDRIEVGGVSGVGYRSGLIVHEFRLYRYPALGTVSIVGVRVAVRAATGRVVITALAAFAPFFRPILRTFDLEFSEPSIMKNDWEKYSMGLGDAYSSPWAQQSQATVARYLLY